MSSTYQRLLSALERHVLHSRARSAADVAVRTAGLTSVTLELHHLPRLIPQLVRALEPHLQPPARESIRRDLEQLQAPLKYVPPDYVPIREEKDISAARLVARGMCDTLGARPLTARKVATVVSELARNIVSYTPGGALELIPNSAPRPRIVIRAVDKGDGITNLPEILAGRYRSRTGLGMGILGSQRLSDRFDIQSDTRGTRIESEIYL